MSAGSAAHTTVIAVEGPAEAAVGAEFVVKVRVSCPAGCDLSGIPIEVTAPDSAAAAVTQTVRRPHPPLQGEGRTAEGSPGWGDGSAAYVEALPPPPGPLTRSDLPPPGGGEEAGEVAHIAVARRIALKAPLRVGEHVWRLSCAAHKSSGWHHDASLLRVPVRVRPHDTSLAVWAIPSPVVTSRPFAIKVGAKSAAGCDLTGMPIAVRDAAGTMLAGGVLGDTPWPGTSSLYWTELTLMAPAAAGMFSWSVDLAAADLALPHQGSSSRFSIAIVDPPEHRLTIKVVAQETASPVENAHVRLGAYRATTDGAGFAQLMVPKGAYDLNVWKSGYDAPTASIVIDADRAVEIAMALIPEENPDAVWQM
jgi:hypothetical protein